MLSPSLLLRLCHFRGAADLAAHGGPSSQQPVADDSLGMVPLGGTLIVAPLSVLDAVWARELASKVVINKVIHQQ